MSLLLGRVLGSAVVRESVVWVEDEAEAVRGSAGSIKLTQGRGSSGP